jgi:hypothetical protein
MIETSDCTASGPAPLAFLRGRRRRHVEADEGPGGSVGLGWDDFTLDVVVPEPRTGGLLGVGLVALAWSRRDLGRRAPGGSSSGGRGGAGRR